MPLLAGRCCRAPVSTSSRGTDLADRALDCRRRSARSPRSAFRRGADVQPELAGIDVREEVARRRPADQRATQPPQSTAKTKPDAPADGATSRPTRRDSVRGRSRSAASKPVMNTRRTSSRQRPRPTFPGADDRHLGRQQVVHHDRHQRSRQQVRQASIANTTARASGVNRYLRGAVEEQHRHEHDADRERRDERRPGDLLRAVENRLSSGLPIAEVAVDVLDLDRRVIDQDADRQGQAAERHHVERMAQRAQQRRSTTGSTAESTPRRSACCASCPGTAGSSPPSAARR